MGPKKMARLQRMGRANWLARIDYDEMLSYFKSEGSTDEELAQMTTGYAHCEIVARHGEAIRQANLMISIFMAKRGIK